MSHAPVYAFVLAGGRGTRLDRLTDWRAKPAMPFGGTLAIVDFTLSNCVHSGVRRIGVLTQYKAQGLIRHVERTWGFLDPGLGEYVDVVPAQQRTGDGWYAGTADAVHQNLELLREARAERVLVLAGDHVYKMDYARLLADHAAHGGGATVATVEVPIEEAHGFGVVGCDAACRITTFDEKPAQPRPLPGRSDRALASMGVYAFDADVLVAALEEDAADPRLDARLRTRPAAAPGRAWRGCARMPSRGSCVRAEGAPQYWRDVGTVDAYWDANLDLTLADAPLTLADAHWPIRGVPAPMAARRGWRARCSARSSPAAAWSRGATVRRSVLSAGVQVGPRCVIEDSVLLPGVRVGAGSLLRRAVVDSGCVLHDGFRAGASTGDDRDHFHVTERGVVLVTPGMLGQHAQACLFD